MKPWLSIIVPVYNVENYLERCLESLLNQSFKDFEIILVDDGSTDSSGKICDEYAQKYRNIVKVIHKENGGLGFARNTGIDYAEGEYVDFVDSDDWMDLDSYRVLNKICSDKNPDVITYGYNKICDNKIISSGNANFEKGFYSKEQIIDLILPNSIAQEKAFDQVNLPTQLSACMCLYKRSFLIENNLFFESERIVLNEDWLFNISCLCRANSFFVVHKKLYNYDTREASLSMSFKPDSYKRKLVLYKRYIEELETTKCLNNKIQHRLDNFWLESIYCCYIIELCAPKICKERINILFSDSEFLNDLKKLNFHNCTVKGMLFKLLVRCKLHSIVRILYCIKKKNMRIS